MDKKERKRIGRSMLLVLGLGFFLGGAFLAPDLGVTIIPVSFMVFGIACILVALPNAGKSGAVLFQLTGESAKRMRKLADDHERGDPKQVAMKAMRLYEATGGRRVHPDDVMFVYELRAGSEES